MKLHPKAPSSLCPTDILFQTTYWSQYKSRLGWKTFAFDYDSNAAEGDVLVLTRELGGGVRVAYVPHGPEFGPRKEEYGPFLERLSEMMLQKLRKAPAFIRYDLPWETQYIEDHEKDSNRNGPIMHPEARVREMRMNFGTERWNLRKAVVDMTVADTFIIDLRGDEEKTLAAMKPKTRYNIRLSQRNGVTASSASMEMLPVFYDLYSRTAERRRFLRCSYECFSALFSAVQAGRGSSEINFVLATHEGSILAGAIIAISGRSARYLFGASANEKRQMMASYAAHWAAIRLALSRGCSTYDMGAVSPFRDKKHRFHGLYRFKTGFGGRIFQRSGSWDYPLDHQKYNEFRNVEARKKNWD
jgi:lipid II:glycine glycyltransferase (peptidoglycan interpeptide bridge formation enzyme)